MKAKVVDTGGGRMRDSKEHNRSITLGRIAERCMHRGQRREAPDRRQTLTKASETWRTCFTDDAMWKQGRVDDGCSDSRRVTNNSGARRCCTEPTICPGRNEVYRSGGRQPNFELETSLEFRFLSGTAWPMLPNRYHDAGICVSCFLYRVHDCVSSVHCSGALSARRFSAWRWQGHADVMLPTRLRLLLLWWSNFDAIRRSEACGMDSWSCVDSD